MKFNTKDYPIVYLSYGEPNTRENYEHLITLFPDALHINDVKGSDTAHKVVAQLILDNYPNSTHVIIVDGDNLLHDDFSNVSYNFVKGTDISDKVLSFSAKNNVNGNQYGNGGVKVWPIKLLLNMRTHENSTDENSIDFDTFNYIELNHVASDTVITGSPEQAWRSGFREGYKLTVGIEYNQINWRNYDRLWRWMHIGSDVENGLWAVYGARMGCYLALTGYDTGKIRDFEFINTFFVEAHQKYKDGLMDECNRVGDLIRNKTKDDKIKQVLISEESKEFKDTVKPILRSEENFIQYKYHPPYDVVFISFNEPNADKNYELVKQKAPKAKRLNGVVGIHNAHIEAAKLCETDYFWVVDADSILVDTFEFEYQIEFNEPEKVRVWRSKNPVNDLIYGNGGVKLLPRMATIRMNTNNTDMTTSISKLYEPILKVSNINEFNIDEFSAWRSAFRECTKLASQVIERQVSKETQERLDTWCTIGIDKPFGKYVIAGAKQGKLYGEQNKNNKDALKCINDYDWLKAQYDKLY
jgi:hypothetical protein